jgi:hypothetical protein
MVELSEILRIGRISRKYLEYLENIKTCDLRVGPRKSIKRMGFPLFFNRLFLLE